MSDLIQLSAPVEIRAEAGDGKSGSKAVSILAYTGGTMEPPGWGPLVIDLAGLDASGQIPLLADHDATLDGIAGHGTARIENHALAVSGSITPSTTAGKKVIDLVKDGFRFQASLGVKPSERTFVKPGETIQANGRTIRADDRGLLHVTAGKLKEVSILALGADANTSVSVAAAASQRKRSMSTTQKKTYDPWILNDDSIRAKAETDGPEAGEELRRRAIEWFGNGDSLVHNHSKEQAATLRARALAGELSVDQLRTEMLEVIRAEYPKGPQIRGAVEPGMVRQAIEATLLVRAGKSALAEKTYGAQTMEATKRVRANSLVDICAACCSLEGRDTGGMNRNEMIRAAFSTISLPTALGNAVGKVLVESYQELTSSWRGFAKIVSAADFKPQTGIRPSFSGQLEQLGPSGEIAHGGLGESLYPWSIDTFAKQLQLTRADVINDDLGFLDQVAPLMGKMAARSLNDLVYRTILANAGNFFHANNGNLLSGGTSPLSLTSLGAAVSAMRKQRDADGNDIDIMPKVLAVPPELEVLARSLLNSAEVMAAEGDTTGNALQGIAELVVESRLSNTAKFSTASTTAWYLFAGPMDAPIIVGFLEGQQTPTIEFFGMSSDINRLGIGWRIFHDFGVALGDYRAAGKSNGA